MDKGTRKEKKSSASLPPSPQKPARSSKSGNENGAVQKEPAKVSNTTSSAPPGAEAKNVRRVIRVQSLARRHLARKKTEQLLKEQRSRASVVRELVTTERTYVEILRQINEFFVQPLLSNASPSRGHLPSARDVQIIFPQISSLLAFHQQFASDLEQRFSAWTPNSQVADLLLRVSPFLEVTYTAFACAYPQAIQKLAEWRHQSRAFVDFIDAALFKVVLPKGIAADVHALLITPVQRPPRYTLLFTEALRFTEPEHADHKVLTDALVQLKQTVEKMERIAAETHSSERIRQIFEAFESKKPNLPPNASRRWIKDGELSVYSPKSKKLTRRAFVLLSDCLLICERKTLPSSSSSSASLVPTLAAPNSSSALSSSPSLPAPVNTTASSLPSGSMILSGDKETSAASSSSPPPPATAPSLSAFVVPSILHTAPSSSSLSGTHGQIPPLKYKKHVMLHRLCVGNRLDSDDGRAKFSFGLSDFSGVDMKKSLVVCADTAQDKAAWLDRLATASEKYKVENEKHEAELTRQAREKASVAKAAISQRYASIHDEEVESLQELLTSGPPAPALLPPVLSGSSQRSSLRGTSAPNVNTTVTASSSSLSSSPASSATASTGMSSSVSHGNISGIRAFALRRGEVASMTRQRSGSLGNFTVPSSSCTIPTSASSSSVAAAVPSVAVSKPVGEESESVSVKQSRSRERSPSLVPVSAASSPTKSASSLSRTSSPISRDRSFSAAFSSPQKFLSSSLKTGSSSAAQKEKERKRDEDDFLSKRTVVKN